MLLPRREDVIHKSWLLRILTKVADNPLLAESLAFKGGTCAAMLGLIDRFSVDLDFDLITQSSQLPKIKKSLSLIFKEFGLIVKDESKKTAQYFLKYPSAGRNTIKFDVVFPVPKANKYEVLQFTDIDRFLKCQTIETMVANKMVAVLDRYQKHKSIAGRDIFDLHSFFIQSLGYNVNVIEGRTGKKLKQFLRDLITFIDKRITLTIINQDLNHLLPYEDFCRIRETIKPELLMLLKDELRRV